MTKNPTPTAMKTPDYKHLGETTNRAAELCLSHMTAETKLECNYAAPAFEKHRPAREAFARAVIEEHTRLRMADFGEGMPSVHSMIGELDPENVISISSMSRVRNLMLAAFGKQNMGFDPIAMRNKLVELESKYMDMCTRLQECVQTHRIGLGGEKIDKLVCEAVADLTAKLAAAEKRLGEIAELPDRWKQDAGVLSWKPAMRLVDELEKALKPAPSAEEVERERFEKSCAQYGLSFTRDEGGNYRDSRTLVLFDVWQAARAAKEGEK
jgi:hypothetical protein